MSELVNMKRSKSEDGLAEDVSEGPKYPYGLQISLDSEAIEKLELAEMPQAGAKMKMMAMVEVVGVRQYDRKDGDSEKGVDLQITDLSLENATEERRMEEALYGDANDNSEIV